MICEELEKEITSETCAAMKKHSWCDQSCEEKKPLLKNGNGDNEKPPQSLPEIIDQDSQISTIAPKEVQSTSETPETILGHSGKKKGEILGRCEKRDEELTWSSCSQRRRRNAVKECQGCDQKPFQFFEQPMGSGWHNSAARAGERECPELGGRRIKKGTCLMRAGKKRHKGQSCVSYCQFWEGEKMEKPSATRALITMWCPTCQAERAGWTNQKTYCDECEAELQVRQPAVEPMTYRCPVCANPVDVEGMLCGDCQVEELKKVESQKTPCPPDNSYERKIWSMAYPEKQPEEKANPIYGIDAMRMLEEDYPEVLEAIKAKAKREMRPLAYQIVWELQKEVKGGN